MVFTAFEWPAMTKAASTDHCQNYLAAMILLCPRMTRFVASKKNWWAMVPLRTMTWQWEHCQTKLLMIWCHCWCLDKLDGHDPLSIMAIAVLAEQPGLVGTRDVAWTCCIAFQFDACHSCLMLQTNVGSNLPMNFLAETERNLGLDVGFAKSWVRLAYSLTNSKIWAGPAQPLPISRVILKIKSLFFVKLNEN